jgi:hypothetical protein
MKFRKSYIYCSPKLIDPLEEVREVNEVLSDILWEKKKASEVSQNGKTVYWQEAYNRKIEIGFEGKGGWKSSPILCNRPLHKGDFLKNDVFVEVQFGNSSTLYRDYYKFHYGFANKLLTLSILIVPTHPVAFFPERNPGSISNMAHYDYALEHYQALPIPVPILIIGLLPEN